ncbi:hypothetical protein MJO28_014295 [Puccinia striiformis f. sp. tritici]|uniref:Uncharacterized protein n=1 Tax=Puccinia striiformis f. sp. tritici TaxID=168172 RepID=A0ACC0DTR9_9BASI|nr:hypothetical protein MJO28_014295 [Puccinia striiformis f. sp. tritici]
MKSKAHLRQSSGNTRPRPGILDQPADLDLIFSTLIINDSPIHQQRSGQPSKATRPADLDHSSKIDHPTDRMFLSDFLNHRKLI